MSVQMTKALAQLKSAAALGKAMCASVMNNPTAPSGAKIEVKVALEAYQRMDLLINEVEHEVDVAKAALQLALEVKDE